MQCLPYSISTYVTVCFWVLGNLSLIMLHSTNKTQISFYSIIRFKALLHMSYRLCLALGHQAERWVESKIQVLLHTPWHEALSAWKKGHIFLIHRKTFSGTFSSSGKLINAIRGPESMSNWAIVLFCPSSKVSQLF